MIVMISCTYMYRINKLQNSPKLNRFAQIARLGETVFHARDLANLWQIPSKNTLYTTLKRYTKQGLLHRVYKGLYTTQPLSEVGVTRLGMVALDRFSYLSCETVLAQAGIMQQQIVPITLVSSVSKRFTIEQFQYLTRQMPDRYLFNPYGLYTVNGVLTASPERSVADLLYFNPEVYLDGAKYVNWKKVKQTQSNIGFPV